MKRPSQTELIKARTELGTACDREAVACAEVVASTFGATTTDEQREELDEARRDLYRSIGRVEALLLECANAATMIGGAAIG